MYHPKNSSSKKNTSFWLVSTVCIRFSQRKCLEQKQNPLVRWSFTEISGNFWCLTVFMRSLQTIGSQLTYRTKNMQKLQSLCLRKKNQSSWDCPSSVKSQPLYSRCFARVGQEKCTLHLSAGAFKSCNPWNFQLSAAVSLLFHSRGPGVRRKYVNIGLSPKNCRN